MSMMVPAASPPTANLPRAVEELAAADVAVNELVIELHGLGRQLWFSRFHLALLLRAAVAACPP
jgi:hypothetical protein